MTNEYICSMCHGSQPQHRAVFYITDEMINEAYNKCNEIGSLTEAGYELIADKSVNIININIIEALEQTIREHINGETF